MGKHAMGSRGTPLSGVSRRVSLVALTVALGCGEEIPPDTSLDAGTECVVAEDCPDQGAELGCVAGRCVAVTEPEQWSCLHEEPLSPGTGTHTVQLTVDDLLASEGLVGASIRICDDIDCTNLLQGPLTTDERGRVTFDVPSGFNGFFLVEKDGYLPTATLRGPVLSNISMTLGLGTASFIQLTAGSFGIELPDFSKKPAGMAVDLTGCSGFTTAGAQISLDGYSSDVLRIYMQNGTISATATETDEFGIAMFFGMDPGDGSAVARSAVSQRLIGTQVAPARIGWITYIYVDAVANR